MWMITRNITSHRDMGYHTYLTHTSIFLHQQISKKKRERQVEPHTVKAGIQRVMSQVFVNICVFYMLRNMFSHSHVLICWSACLCSHLPCNMWGARIDRESERDTHVNLYVYTSLSLYISLYLTVCNDIHLWHAVSRVAVGLCCRSSFACACACACMCTCACIAVSSCLAVFKLPFSSPCPLHPLAILSAFSLRSSVTPSPFLLHSPSFLFSTPSPAPWNLSSSPPSHTISATLSSHQYHPLEHTTTIPPLHLSFGPSIYSSYLLLFMSLNVSFYIPFLFPCANALFRLVEENYPGRGTCPIWMSNVIYKWVVLHINESCHVTYEWVMSHMKESRHIWMSHVTYK